MGTPMNITSSTPSPSQPAQSAITALPKSAPSEASDATILLHPLVVINISDHFNRFAAMRLFPAQTAASATGDNPPPPTLTDSSGNVRVIGLLLGVHVGRQVDVCHSFELPARCGDDGEVSIDVHFLQIRVEQYQQIFPHYNVVGWYSTGAALTEDDLRLHTDVFSPLYESPFLMLMNVTSCMSALSGRLALSSASPSASPSASASPAAAPSPTAAAGPTSPIAATTAAAIAIYQAEIHMSDAGPRALLAPVAHRFASADSERIAVDHVSRHAGAGGGGDASATQHLRTLRRSVQMLSARVDVLLGFLRATEEGKIEVDCAMLRRVSGVCARLPEMERMEFGDAFLQERMDSVAVTYLCGLTKSMCAMNELVEQFAKAGFDKSSSVGGRRRM